MTNSAAAISEPSGDSRPEIGSQDVARLGQQIRDDLGDSQTWHVGTGYESLALCVLDSIYSTGHHYTGVVNLLNRYRQLRRAEGADPTHDSTTHLLQFMDAVGGPAGFAEVTNNRWRAWSRNSAPLKANAAQGAAQALQNAGITTVQAARRMLTEPTAQESSPAKRAWLAVPGQRSGLTWTYFLMLAGIPGVKADRMIVRYATRVLGREVAAKGAATLVKAVADQRQLSPIQLDHAIWRFESGREVHRQPD